MQKRPNILFITSDQHRGDCFGFEGRRVRTPHLDDLAHNGTRFTSCITPSLVCQPSRASILTGLLPLTNGVRDNGIDLDVATGEAGFAGSLAASGYHTAFLGKAHFSSHHTYAPTGRPECQHSASSYPQTWFGPYMGFEHVELIVEGHNYWLPAPPPSGAHHSRWYYGDGRGEERNALYKKDLGPPTGAPQTFFSALPAAWHNSAWVGDRTIAFLKNKHDRPFCMWVSFPDPHHPFDCPEPWSRLHAPEEVDIPKYRHTDFERRPWWHRASMENRPVGNAEMQEIRRNFSRMGEQPEAQLRHVIANYYGMISLIDHQVGRILCALSETGADQDTLVIFSSDHGEWLGDHGLMLKGPMAYEGLLRVGLVISGPGVPQGKLVHDPVSTLDLAPTFVDYGSASALGPLHGKSLRGLIEGNEETRECAYSEWDVQPSRCGVPLQLRTVRTTDWKLTLELTSGAGEMYCLQDDPHECTNRFDDPGAATVRQRLISLLKERPDDALAQGLPYSGFA
jgi:arylsulfatase A-like enzyme